MMTEQYNKLPSRERILAVAEEVFLVSGFDGVSVRELTEAAGVNIALVNYHFGSKRNLYLEALRHKFSAVSEMKCAQLQQQLIALEKPGLPQVVSAYVTLYLGSDEDAQATQKFLKLISRRLADDDDAMELLFAELIAPIHLLVRDALGQICPGMGDEKLSLCIGSMTGQIFHYLRFPHAFQTLLGSPGEGTLRDAMVQHIIDFSMKGIGEESVCLSKH